MGVGSAVGAAAGSAVGSAIGSAVGSAVGSVVGVGSDVGSGDGSAAATNAGVSRLRHRRAICSRTTVVDATRRLRDEPPLNIDTPYLYSGALPASSAPARRTLFECPDSGEGAHAAAAAQAKPSGVPLRKIRIQSSVPLCSGATRHRAHRGHIPYLYPYFSLYHRTRSVPYASGVDDSLAIGLEGGPGIRDAEAILERSREDERAAFDARALYRTEGLPPIEADGTIAESIRPGEIVVSVRGSSVVGRHLRGDGNDDFAGRLYLTSQRLVVLGHTSLEVELDEVDELALAGERLLVTLNDGTGLSIDAIQPRLLRVQIAAALTAGREPPLPGEPALP